MCTFQTKCVHDMLNWIYILKQLSVCGYVWVCVGMKTSEVTKFTNLEYDAASIYNICDVSMCVRLFILFTSSRVWLYTCVHIQCMTVCWFTWCCDVYNYNFRMLRSAAALLIFDLNNRRNEWQTGREKCISSNESVRLQYKKHDKQFYR